MEAPIPARRHRRWTRGGDARCEDADVLAAEADATLAQRPTVDHDVAMLRRVTTSDHGEESGSRLRLVVTLGYTRAHIRTNRRRTSFQQPFQRDSAQTPALFHKRVCFVLL